jgi:hypothetical protein
MRRARFRIFRMYYAWALEDRSMQRVYCCESFRHALNEMDYIASGDSVGWQTPFFQLFAA